MRDFFAFLNTHIYRASTINSTYCWLFNVIFIYYISSHQVPLNLHVAEILWMGQRNPASPKGWLKPIQNHGIWPTYQLAQDFATIHRKSSFSPQAPQGHKAPWGPPCPSTEDPCEENGLVLILHSK